MSSELTRESLLAFRNRRWDLMREAKEQFWADETRARGPEAGFAAGEALWMHAREMDPSWPTDEDRRADFSNITSNSQTNSGASLMPSSVGETLRALASVLDALGVGWYLFGAQAALARGSHRLTEDIDVTVFTRPPGCLRMS